MENLIRLLLLQRFLLNFHLKQVCKKMERCVCLLIIKKWAQQKPPGLFKKELELPLQGWTGSKKGNEKIADYPDSYFILRSNLTNAKLETLEGIARRCSYKSGTIDKVIIIKVVKDVMKYDKQLITAKAGTTIQIVMQNPDFMQHNFVLIKPENDGKSGCSSR